MTLISRRSAEQVAALRHVFSSGARPPTEKTELTLNELCQCFDTGLAGVVKLGKPSWATKRWSMRSALAALHRNELISAALRRGLGACEAARSDHSLIEGLPATWESEARAQDLRASSALSEALAETVKASA
jgi:hypothetical protein